MKKTSFLLLFFGWAMASSADTIYVTPIGGSSGSSWLDPCSFAEALLMAEQGDQVWVKQGTYYISTAVPGTQCNALPFLVPEGISVFGSLTGTEGPSYNMALRNFSNISYLSGGNSDGEIMASIASTDTYETIIDGFHFINAGKAAVLSFSKFTFRNCVFNGFNTQGGVIESYSSQTTLEKCLFQNNNIEFAGGVLLAKSSILEATACRFDENTSSAYNVFGGSVLDAQDTASIIFTNCAFYGNECTNTIAMQNTVPGSFLGLVNCSFYGTVVNASMAPVVFSIVNIQNSSVYDAAFLAHLQSITIPGMLWLESSIVPSLSLYSGTSLTDTDPGLTLPGLNIPGTWSSAYNAGNNNLNSTTHDLAGHLRVYANVIDIGAFEYCASGCSNKTDEQKTEEEGQTSSGFAIYPNPNNGMFTVETSSPITSLEVINSVGQVIILKTNSLVQREEIDLTSSASGIYYVKVETFGNGAMLMERIIVQ